MGNTKQIISKSREVAAANPSAPSVWKVKNNEAIGTFSVLSQASAFFSAGKRRQSSIGLKHCGSKDGVFGSHSDLMC